MWLLETDGEVFGGKTLWLRPGRRFLFGRTVSEPGNIAISDKTISRKHLIIEVEQVAPGDGMNVDCRSRVTLQDQKTKIGTFLDGVQIRGQTVAVDGLTHEIKLGHHKHSFRLSWKPIVFTFASAKRAQLEKHCQRLERLDMKVQSSYVTGVTTHVVSEKRNTSKGLQALIQGKHIVSTEFLSSVEAASKLPAEHAEAQSPLEVDYQSNWPLESNYLPPKGNEPTDCPDSSYYPDPRRQDVFKGYTFVFYEKSQFESLLAPILLGRGKARLRQAVEHETTVDEFTAFVKEVAGETGLGEFEDGSEGQGVVVVRSNPVQGSSQTWYSDFIKQMSLRLDHRLIEQNEFLDAVLKNNASCLRRPLEYDEPATAAEPRSSAPTSSTLHRETSEVESVVIKHSGSSPPPPPEPRRGRPRRQATSRFKGFDDGFDAGSVSIPESFPPQSVAADQSQEHGLFVSQDTSMADEPDLPVFASQKRALSPLAEDMMETLAPAASRLKKRRLEETAARRARGETTPPPPPIKEEKEITPPKPKKKEVDLIEAARKRREEQEAQIQADREALDAALEGMDINEIRKLTVIEECTVGRTAPKPVITAHADESPRWEERWNGRKNFKKFRRRGGQQPSFSKLRTIVPLDEVRKKDMGGGYGFWEPVDSSVSSSVRRPRQPTADASTLFTTSVASGPPATRDSAPPDVVPNSSDNDEPPGVLESGASSGRPTSRQPSRHVSTAPSRAESNSAAGSQQTYATAASKRPASTASQGGPPAKMRQTSFGRQKVLRVADSEDEDEDSEEEMRFRFRR